MNPFEIIWEFAVSKLENTKFLFPAVIGAVIISGTLWLLPKLKRWRCRVGTFAIAVGLVIAEFNLLLKWNRGLLYCMAGFLVLFPLLCFVIPFLWNKWRLRKIQKVCKQQSYIEALEILNTVRTGWLTTKQLHNYQKRRFFLFVRLGSLRKARTYLEEICPEKGAFYHFALHILAYYSGDLKTSSSEIQIAEDCGDLKSDPFLQFQIIMNHGVCYAAEKNYHLADEYYRKAIAFYDGQRLRDEELLCTFYYNFAFNQLRLNPNTAAWRTALDECQSRLNLKKTDAQVLMLNLRLELLRQTEAPREIIDKLLQSAFSTITGSRLPLKNKVLFASSAARVAWAAQVNPFPCLKLLSDNLSVIDGLPADQRYQVYAQLDILFHDLYGPANDSFITLKSRASDYLKNEAESDLRQWQNGLPEEAIYARCDCLKKRAILSRNCILYDWDSVISFQKDAVQLYHDNKLYLDELHTRQDIMDELLDGRNRDEDYRLVCVDEMRDHLTRSEELLSQLAGHPALVETYIRLGCYSLDLDEYEKSLSYARLFWNTGISAQNFAPWVRRYYAILLFHVRVILFDRAIKEASEDKRLRTFNKDIQDWFATYPKHDGMLETLLLSRFLSIGMGKRKIWVPDGESEPQGHTWLWIPEFGWNIDLTYPQFTDDRLCRSLFFPANRHPFEAGTSLALQISRQKTGLIFESVLCSQVGQDLPEEAMALVDKIYNFLCNYIPQDCPTTEECIWLLQEFTRPIPIQA